MNSDVSRQKSIARTVPPAAVVAAAVRWLNFNGIHTASK